MQIKQKQSEVDESHKTTEGGEQESAMAEIQKSASSNEKGEELSSNLDRIGSLVTVGLDLVEASLTLGMNLVNKLGSKVQEQVIDRIDNPYPEQREGPYEEPGMGRTPFYQDEQGRPAEAATTPAVSYVVNRLPLFPGSPVNVSFTINNDSASSPKKLRLRVEDLTGEMHGTQLNGKDFKVKPATKVIGPMDFDKFTITGAIPADVSGDMYHGWIVVSEEEELKIPVRLIVTSQP